MTGQEKKVYFTQGHGERDTAQLGSAARLQRDLAGADRATTSRSRRCRSSSRRTCRPTPRSSSSPARTTDFLQPEIDALKRYVAKGGKVLFLIDPPEPDAADVPNLRGFLKEWAIELGNDVVVDASGMGQLFGGDASVPVAASYPPHPITEASA